MYLRRFKYWKTKEIEDFYIFKAKIVEIEKYNELANNGKYDFIAEYIVEYPLSETKELIRGYGSIFHNLISPNRIKPTVGTVLELMARPNDLKNKVNWEIHIPVADDVSQEVIDQAKDFLRKI